jgi:hypothetical protein
MAFSPTSSGKEFVCIMPSDNAMSAGNQQERLDVDWVVGFVDGEGCFHVGINRQPQMRLGWQVLPEFRVVQHQKDEMILRRLQSFFDCGSVGVNNGDRMEFRVRGVYNLNKIVRFFGNHPLKTRKLQEFHKFAQILQIIEAKRHLSISGLVDIAALAIQMNQRRNQSASRILRDYMPNTRKGEDIVRPPWRHGEVTGNRGPPPSDRRSMK